ncbi:MAG TPA: glycosyl hydrolase family 8 [Bacteroides graminisolvens]|nr:glycosyl hydrolase family 8 [Bacteroides graminisolvens]
MNTRKIWLTFLLCLMVHLSGAQNPIIRHQFSADPTARVFDGKVYVYPSHDIPSPVERLKEWFCMADYHVFSSNNLVDWEDHGVILSQENVPWVNAESYSMWAPDCVFANGKYYFYFPASPKGENQRGFKVGVAVADKPTGPFTPLAEPIKGINGIDPCVLIDKNGEAYIYWSGRGMYVARLKSNMTELASEPVQIKNLPEGFMEGPFAFERNGKYYFTFPWVQDKTETLAYAMGDSPMGPFEFKGLIMDQSATGCWTNHHSLVEYNKQWYLFYHHNDYSPAFDKNRSVRVDSLSFNADGTIKKVVPTLRGVGLTTASSKIQLDRYSQISNQGAAIAFVDENNKFEGWKAVFTKPGAWLRYNRVDFGEGGYRKMQMRVNSSTGGVVEIRTADKAAKLLASLVVPKSDGWIEKEYDLKLALRNVHDLSVSLKGEGQVEIDWMRFGQNAGEFALQSRASIKPWEQGAFETRKYRNLFAEAGYKQADIDAKLKSVFNDLFYGANKVYFETNDSMAYVSDIKNHDVRTEGMSYGLMIAVQFNRKDIFDRLWRWCKKYMQHQEGPLEGYFAWSCKTDGTRNAQGPASDGELYYVTSLIFASNSWGNDSDINYLGEAQHILNCSMKKDGTNRVMPLINMEHKLITFVPDTFGGRFTDPSYHVPAFYEVWARWANDGRADFWRECAARSREYLHKSIHPVTGLNPDYNNYDGSLLNMKRGIIGDAFRFDSWRVPMNIALDYSWACADKEWQQGYGNKIQNFLYSQGIDTFVDQYNVDGTTVAEILDAGGYKQLRHSLGLVATAAAASLVTTHTKSYEFVDKLWNAKHEPYEDGYFDAYYDGLLRLFAFMHLSGNYRIIFPQ